MQFEASIKVNAKGVKPEHSVYVLELQSSPDFHFRIDTNHVILQRNNKKEEVQMNRCDAKPYFNLYTHSLQFRYKNTQTFKRLSSLPFSLSGCVLCTISIPFIVHRFFFGCFVSFFLFPHIL